MATLSLHTPSHHHPQKDLMVRSTTRTSCGLTHVSTCLHNPSRKSIQFDFYVKTEGNEKIGSEPCRRMSHSSIVFERNNGFASQIYYQSSTSHQSKHNLCFRYNCTQLDINYQQNRNSTSNIHHVPDIIFMRCNCGHDAHRDSQCGTTPKFLVAILVL